MYFRASPEKKPGNVNPPKAVIAADKENEIEKRRKELAKQKELREKQAKEEVCVLRKPIGGSKIALLGG